MDMQTHPKITSEVLGGGEHRGSPSINQLCDTVNDRLDILFNGGSQLRVSQDASGSTERLRVRASHEAYVVSRLIGVVLPEPGNEVLYLEEVLVLGEQRQKLRIVTAIDLLEERLDCPSDAPRTYQAEFFDKRDALPLMPPPGTEVDRERLQYAIYLLDELMAAHENQDLGGEDMRNIFMDETLH